MLVTVPRAVLASCAKEYEVNPTSESAASGRARSNLFITASLNDECERGQDEVAIDVRSDENKTLNVPSHA
jgi:hypothetical protein